MVKFLLKSIHLTNPRLISLRNNLRKVLYKKTYDLIFKFSLVEKKFFKYSVSLDKRLKSKDKTDFRVLSLSKDYFPDFSIDGNDVIERTEGFLKYLKESDINERDKYRESRIKYLELKKYQNGLRELLKNSIVVCYECGDVSCEDMYRLPLLGVTDIIAGIKYIGTYWEGIWVCKEHLIKLYRPMILKDWGVDILKLTKDSSPVKERSFKDLAEYESFMEE